MPHNSFSKINLENVSSNFELEFKVSSLGAQSVGILFKSSIIQTSSIVEYNFASQELTSRSVNGMEFEALTEKPQQSVETSKPIGFRIFVDGSLVEVFLSTGQALSLRVYRSEQGEICFYSLYGDSQFSSMKVWELGSAWE